MRLKADQPEAERVSAVLLNGKVVPMVHEFDDSESWVVSYMPDLPGNPAENGEELIEDDESRIAGLRLIKRHGKVEVKFRSDQE
jgi:hypothetical protein